MNNTVNLILCKNLCHSYFIFYICLIRNNFLTRNFFNTIHCFCTAITVIIYDNYVMSCC